MIDILVFAGLIAVPAFYIGFFVGGIREMKIREPEIREMNRRLDALDSALSSMLKW